MYQNDNARRIAKRTASGVKTQQFAGGYHGGNAPAVKAKARLRLEMASDRLARQLLNMTTDPNVADPVKLAAIKDALDRGGLTAKTAVGVEVSAKPFELVFDSLISGPRARPPALALENTDAAIESTKPGESDNGEILGEYDDDPLPERDEIQPDPLRKQREWESEHTDVLDVEIMLSRRNPSDLRRL